MLERMDDFFTARVEGYDEHMRQYVEEDSAFYAFTASLLPMTENAAVLDLGCGTGLELEAFFDLNPAAKVTGIDLTEAMLNALKDKLPDKDITTVCGSYFDVPFGEEAFHAAVSVESLHHFSEEEKLPLYTKLWKALKPGGCFVLTDFFADTDDQEAYFRRELIRLRKEQDLADGVFYHYDTPMTVDHEKKLLLSAGFSNVEELGSWGSTHTLRAEK
ncbi:MAG: class I SAM-dependent methyltransferase [Lachnospiraceae bacterium]|nr:class I SAM-dependent methyltransferase [Lachnospiraceae bacterium]